MDKHWTEHKYYEREPWHYVLFSQYQFYRGLMGGCWLHVMVGGERMFWVRVQ